MAVNWNDLSVRAAARRGALRGVVMGAEIIRTEMISLILNTAKTGRIYRRRGVTHQASAPGEPPASDTGRLVGSISTRLDAANLRSIVNVAAAYGLPLEYGTERMEPRPFARPALANKREQVIRVVSEQIRSAIGG